MPAAPLAGRTALVTGSDRGIGYAVASTLFAAGAAVGVTALPANEGNARERVAELDASGARAHAYPLDVRSSESVRETFDTFLADFGRIDVLINNAGVRAVSAALSTEESEWDEVMSVNVRGAFLCCQQAARHMKENGGAIVNVASQLGLVAARDRAAYCASKAALIHLTRSLALDWAVYGIRVNAVAPGPARTDDLEIGSDPAAAADFLSRMPLGRPIEPQEVADAVAHLAGPTASATTGHVMVVDGGWTLA